MIRTHGNFIEFLGMRENRIDLYDNIISSEGKPVTVRILYNNGNNDGNMLHVKQTIAIIACMWDSVCPFHRSLRY